MGHSTKRIEIHWLRLHLGRAKELENISKSFDNVYLNAGSSS